MKRSLNFIPVLYHEYQSVLCQTVISCDLYTLTEAPVFPASILSSQMTGARPGDHTTGVVHRFHRAPSEYERNTSRIKSPIYATYLYI